jgi:asparagine synthase (glutamine-hydrolysing)
MFARLLARFERLSGCRIACRTERDWCTFAVTSPEFGASQALVIDPESGAFLAIIGAWVEVAGPGPASPERLLRRCLREPLTSVVRDIEGAFFLVFGDPRTHGVAMATDIVGSLHVFVRDVPGGLAICTSARALAALGAGALDPVAAQEFWASGIIFEDRSLWQGVRKLGPGRIVTIDAQMKRSEKRYWSFEEVNGNTLSLKEASARLGDALVSAATRIARAYPNILADVTGGYDSRAAISGFVGAGIRFCATVSGPSTSADVIVSKRIGETLKIPHYHVEIEVERRAAVAEDALALTDGEYELFEYARIAATHRGHARRGLSASVNGSFGELARGYWWELLFPWLGAIRPLDATRLSRKRFAAIPYDTGAIEEKARLDFRDHMSEVVARSVALLAGKPNTTQMDHAYLDLRMQRWHGRISSSTLHIWPCFSPFMFRSVLMPILDAVPLARWRSLLVRRLLADRVPVLANLPLEHGYPATTARLTNIHRFAPVAAHYFKRIRDKIAGGHSPSVAAGSDLTLLEELSLRDPASWMLAAHTIFATERLPHYVEQAAREGLSLAGRRLLTIELAVRSVSQSAQMSDNPAAGK